MGIGSKLNELMKKRGTNANELAQKIGVPPTTIYSMIKRDNKKADIDVLLKIARELGVSAEYFSEESVSSPIPTLAAHFEGEDFTPEELEEIYNFAEFVRAKRKF